MLDRDGARRLLDAAIDAEGEGICVPPNADPTKTRADIVANLCEPREVEAIVVEPGMPFADVGAKIKGICIAHASGYWLVYQPAEERFLCFWGKDESNLGAHGVYGNPLYCWAA
jgi:hypothetical protein